MAFPKYLKEEKLLFKEGLVDYHLMGGENEKK